MRTICRLCFAAAALLAATAIDVGSSSAAAGARAQAPVQRAGTAGSANATSAWRPEARPPAADAAKTLSLLRRAEGFTKGISMPLLMVVRRRLASREEPTPAVPRDEADVDATEAATEAATGFLIWNAIYLSIVLVCAWFYKSQKEWAFGQGTNLKTSEKNFKEWTSPEVEPFLLWSCLLPSIRWADTMSMAGILPDFWKAFFIFFCIAAVTSFGFGVIGWIVMTIFLVVFRTKFRAKFEMQQSYFADFCCYCWCQPCLVAQEARHAEEAYAAGYLP